MILVASTTSPSETLAWWARAAQARRVAGMHCHRIAFTFTTLKDSMRPSIERQSRFTRSSASLAINSRTIDAASTKARAASGAGLHLGFRRLLGQEFLHTMLKLAGGKAQVKQAALQP